MITKDMIRVDNTYENRRKLAELIFSSMDSMNIWDFVIKRLMDDYDKDNAAFEYDLEKVEKHIDEDGYWKESA